MRSYAKRRIIFKHYNVTLHSKIFREQKNTIHKHILHFPPLIIAYGRRFTDQITQNL